MIDVKELCCGGLKRFVSDAEADQLYSSGVQFCLDLAGACLTSYMCRRTFSVKFAETQQAQPLEINCTSDTSLPASLPAVLMSHFSPRYLTSGGLPGQRIWEA